MEKKWTSRELCTIFAIYLINIGEVTSHFPSGVQYPASRRVLGEGCTHSSGVAGVCRLYTDCRGQEHKLWKANTCGYIKKDPVWCCPLEPIKQGKVLNSPNVNFQCGKVLMDNNFVRERSNPEIDRFSSLVPNVVGGEPALPNSWPWAALIGDITDPRDPQWYCGGSLINKDWILTSAHCLLRDKMVVRLGEHDYSDPFDGTIHKDVDIAETVLHPGYKPSSNNHDLALIRLQESVEFNARISPVCLPWTKTDDDKRALRGNLLTTIGWGAVEFSGPQSTVLMEANVTVFDTEVCESSYSTIPSYDLRFPEGIDDEHFICAGDSEGRTDSCTGDSGGPLLQKEIDDYIQVAIVSLGYGCGNSEFPGLYVSLLNKQYLNWIRNVAFAEYSN